MKHMQFAYTHTQLNSKLICMSLYDRISKCLAIFLNYIPLNAYCVQLEGPNVKGFSGPNVLLRLWFEFQVCSSIAFGFGFHATIIIITFNDIIIVDKLILTKLFAM